MGINKELYTSEGNPVILGANRCNKGINFAVEIPDNKSKKISLVLYRRGKSVPENEIELSENHKIGKVFALNLGGIEPEDYEYNYKIDEKIIQDPFAHVIRGRKVFGQSDYENEHAVRCGFISSAKYNWEDDIRPEIPYNNLVLYKLHVRGYTKQAKITAKKRGTFAGLADMIPYWKDLGINAIELMPAYDFNECPNKPQHDVTAVRSKCDERINYWGYTKGFYFAPKSSYCMTDKPDIEFRDLIKALHKAGIECIMEMYFPKGTTSLLQIQALWFWKIFYHVDGFHLMGDGVNKESIISDPVLYGTKKIFSTVDEDADADDMLAECNQSFMEDMRRFLKSDEGMISCAEYHMRRNNGTFGTVNYIASQDGFTLYDTVSYNYRHNELNGECNHDGSDYNYSWNCGVEGKTRKQAIRKMREQQMRNAFLMLILAQGTPMIYAGDEFANSQEGNNNAWCQDNPIGWTDWKNIKKQENLWDFVKKTLKFRKNHPILHMPTMMHGVDYMAKGFPDISVHGERAWFVNRDNTSRLLGIMYCGAYAETENGITDDNIYIGMNFHWEKRKIALPNLSDDMSWHVIADTSETDTDKWFKLHDEVFIKSIEINPRTIVVLVAKQEESGNASVASL